MADGRLAEPKALAGTRHAALLDQCIEYAQQIQVQGVEMKAIHWCNAKLSFECKGVDESL